MHLFTVIPCYNCETYLQASVESVLSSSPDRKFITVILVDDGSTDRTPMLCDQFAEQNKGRVIAVHQKNGCVSAARNAGIDYVLEHFTEVIPQSYFAFLDADDAWMQGFWDAENLALLQKGYELIGFQSCKCSSDLKRRAELSDMEEGVFSGGNRALGLHYVQSFASMLYACRLLERNLIRFNTKLSYSEDKIFRMRCLYYADSVCLKNKLFYCYRSNRRSLMSRRSYGIEYWLPIIEGYLSLEWELNASSAGKGPVLTGTIQAWRYLMKMVEEHFQCFRSKKKIEAFFESNPKYVQLLEGKNEKFPEPNKSYLSMRSMPWAFQFKNYRKGFGVMAKRLIKQFPFSWWIAEKIFYRIEL